MANLSVKLQQVRQKQDEERKRLNELRQLLRNAPGLEKEVSIFLCFEALECCILFYLLSSPLISLPLESF